MGDERGDDAAERRRADVYSSARIGAAAALTIVLVVLLVLDVVVPDYHVSPGILLPRSKAPNVVKVKLTPMAERTGLPALLPEDVSTEWALARPTGVERAAAITIRIPVEGVESRREAEGA
jgi:hypothetical protein